VTALVALALVLLYACAEGKLEDQPDASDVDQDDVRSRDLSEDPVVDVTPDPIDEQPGDTSTDQDEPELAGECTPFEAWCTEDGYSIQRCSSIGSLFEPSPCALDEVCEEDTGGVNCVPCEEGVNCRSEATECEPDTNFCLDYQTAAHCDSDGQVATTIGCGDGRCFGGGCNTSGVETGEACTENTGCYGRTCLCGTEDTDNLSTALCSGNLAAGYCTTGDCQLNGCDPDTEVCADFELSGAFGGRHYCLLKEDCGTRLWSCLGGHRGDGHVCRELPVSDSDGTRRTWELACWTPPPGEVDLPCPDENCLSPISWPCNTDDDCVGGLCMHLSGNITYCSAPCDETHECPSYTECVRIDEGSDNHFCLAKANLDDCPRMGFDISRMTFPTIGGFSSASVCFAD